MKNLTIEMFRSVGTCEDGIKMFIKTFGGNEASYEEILKKATELDALSVESKTEMSTLSMEFVKSTQAVLIKFKDELGIIIENESEEYFCGDKTFNSIEDAKIYQELLVDKIYLSEKQNFVLNILLENTIDNDAVTFPISYDSLLEKNEDSVFYILNPYNGNFIKCLSKSEAIKSCELIYCDMKERIQNSYIIRRKEYDYQQNNT